MLFPHAQSSRKDIELEEQPPPAYEASPSEHHQREGDAVAVEEDDPDVPPKPEATPQQVRAYIEHLLTTKRTLPVDHAQRIAAKWTTGNGQDLHSYPPAMYLEIFGREDGWTVYMEVKVCIYLQEGEKFDSVFLIILAWGAEAGLLYGLVWAGKNKKPLSGTFMGIFAFVVLLACITWPIELCSRRLKTREQVEKSDRKKFEKTVRKELEACMKSDGTARTYG